MRADKYFSEKFGSRTKAAEAIEKGLVLINGKTIKSKTEIKDSDSIAFIEANENFVSNGGYKLKRAIQEFPFDCNGKVFADIGASTGGFTDCLLQHGARRVYAVDVGESLLHEKLRNREEIVLMENTNARYLTRDDFPEPLDGVVTDVSFISLRLIFPVIRQILSETGEAVVLIKPQFECDNKHIGKSGIVSPSAHAEIVARVIKELISCDLYPHGIVNAPVRKGKNIEYVVYIKRQKRGALDVATVSKTVKELIKRNANGKLQ